MPPSAIPVPARASGYVQIVHLEQLLAAAAARRVNVRVQPRIGEHVVAGTPLAWIWPASPELPAPPAEAFSASLAAAVRIGFERTLEQDPGLGLRQLVDPACKALSPAVNDPYTAIQAVEHLSVLFAALAARPLGPIVAHDPTAGVTVVVAGTLVRRAPRPRRRPDPPLRRPGTHRHPGTAAAARDRSRRLHRTRPLVGDRGPGRSPRRRGRTRGSRTRRPGHRLRRGHRPPPGPGRPSSRRPATTSGRHPSTPPPPT